MPVTLREVAEAAGVSIAAVSKVLHGAGDSVRVSVTKADHIRAVAKQMDYRPNLLARNLRQSRTHTIGLIWENFSGIASGPLYFMHLLDGIAGEVVGRHYRLTILPEMKHEDVLTSLGDGQLEGVLWCKLAKDRDTLDLIHNAPIPIVALNAPAPTEPTKAVFVACDNEAGIELAVDHLWTLGHRRLLFANELEEADTPDCIARRSGFLAALRARGVEPTQDDTRVFQWTMGDFEEWWIARTGHTAIVCWSERCGAEILKAAARLGISIPDDLSIVGFDSTQFCETTSPRLTAVRQPISEMARKATEVLFDLIGGCPPAGHSYIYPCSLDLRDSTSKPSLRAEEELIS